MPCRSPKQEEADGRVLIRWIRDSIQRGAPEFSWRDIRHGNQQRFAGDDERLRGALRLLERWNCIRVKPADKKQSRGRPAKPTYEVNPALLGL